MTLLPTPVTSAVRQWWRRSWDLPGAEGSYRGPALAWSVESGSPFCVPMGNGWERGLNLVAVCVSDSAFAASALNDPASFAAALARGPLPDWLEPVALGPAIRVYRVRD